IRTEIERAVDALVTPIEEGKTARYYQLKGVKKYVPAEAVELDTEPPTEIVFLRSEQLQQSLDGSFYTIVGAGGPLEEWIKGYEELFKKNGLEKPSQWFRTTGAEINAFAKSGGRSVR